VLYLNSLRGIAAFLVVFYHVKHLIVDLLSASIFQIVSSSYLAVDFFFILSGFILCWKYFDEFSGGGFTKKLSVFIKKRLIRIYPLHLLLLLAYLIIPFILFLTERPPMERYSLEMILPHLLLIQDWGWFESIGWNVPSWSISAEFLAYITFPFVSALIVLLPRFVSLLGLLFSYICFIVVFTIYDADSIGEYIAALGWLRCLVGFYFGVSIYFFLKQATVIRYVTVTLGIIFVISTSLILSLPNYYYIHILFGLFLWSTIEFKPVFGSLLNNRPLQFLGNISYSVYMTHYLIRDLMTMVFLDNNEQANWWWLICYVLLTLIVSTLTFKLVEVHMKNWLNGKLLS